MCACAWHMGDHISAAYALCSTDYVKTNANTDGTDSFGMRFRVNGSPLYVRGANMIPMDELEGSSSLLVASMSALPTLHENSELDLSDRPGPMSTSLLGT